MPPTRRRLIRWGGLSFTGIAGCTTSRTPQSTDYPPAPTPTRPPSTETPTDTATPGTGSSTTPSEAPESADPLRCGPGPLPATGWPLPDRSLGRTNYAPTASGPTGSPSAAWTVTPPAPELGQNAFTRPVVADGRVYVGRRIEVGPERPNPDAHYVHAYDAASGDEVWRSLVDREPHTPMVADGAVLVDDDAALYALDAETGERRWTFDAPGGVHHALPTPDGLLVAPWRAEPDRVVIALDEAGRERWRVEVPGHVGSEPAWVDSRAFLVTSEAVLVAIDTDEATVAWTRDLQDGEDTVPASLAVTPCAVFAAVDGTLYAVRPTGDLEWSTDAGVRELATDGEVIFGVDGDGYVRAIDVVDGDQRWERFVGREDRRYTDGFYDKPVVDGRTLYAGSLDRKLFAIATADGRSRWTIELDWTDAAQVAVVDDTLYAAGGRHLVAYR